MPNDKPQAKHYEQAITEAYRDVYCHPYTLNQINERAAELARTALDLYMSRPTSTPPDAWQPIESAPKTGRTILLGYFNFHDKWRTLRGQWFSKAMIEDWEDGECCEEGWYETAVEPDEPNCWATNPTHWQPLPGAPT